MINKKKIKIYSNSLKGNFRKTNQDSLAYGFDKNNNLIAIVCDGVGSIDGSEYASKFISNFFLKSFITNKHKSIKKWFIKILDESIKQLKNIAIKKQKIDISTTLAILIIKNNYFYIFNIGDTRIYKISKNNKIYQLTYDHNFKNYLLKQNVTNEILEINKSRWFSLTSFIDANNKNAANFYFAYKKISFNSQFILCTDGVYNYISKKELLLILNNQKNIHIDKSKRLNKQALKNGSQDNVSNIIIEFKKN